MAVICVFKRQFSLADCVQVRGATLDNGVLKIELFREVPEAMKPRDRLEGSAQIEGHAAKPSSTAALLPR
jgi:molecular chaperone IbpA